MVWQTEMAELIMTRLPGRATAEVTGSATRPELLDGWSDLDLHLGTDHQVRLAELVDPAAVWVCTDTDTSDGHVVRVVLTDGRRLDLSVHGAGRIVHDQLVGADDPRMLLVLAATKLGRGDRLVGLHLLLEFGQECLVLQMETRDHDTGTVTHRHGTAHDRVADEVNELLGRPLALTPRPTPSRPRLSSTTDFAAPTTRAIDRTGED